jgi:hypothetical protein
MAEIGSAQPDAAGGSGTDTTQPNAVEEPGMQAARPEAVTRPAEGADTQSGQPGAVVEPATQPAQTEALEVPREAVPSSSAGGFMQRAVLRRRARFLRRRREMALHDLGGFVFESHRLGQSGDDLLAEKLAAISRLDDELATIEQALDLREELAVLHEPGIASCPQCSTIHDSSARYCPTCGRPTTVAAP